MPDPHHETPPPSGSMAPPRKGRGSRPVEELVDGVRRCATDLGGPPTIAGYRRWARRQVPHAPGPEGIILRIGSWTETLSRAGLDLTERRRSDGGPVMAGEGTARAIDALRRFAQHAEVNGLDAGDHDVAARLTRADYDVWRHDHQPDAPNLPTVQAALGAWSAALHAAGLASTPERPQKPRIFPDDAILRALRAAAAELRSGLRLSMGDYQAWREAGPGEGAPTSRLIWERFGSWAAALDTAGVVPSRQAGPSGAEALGALRRFLDDDASGVFPEAYLGGAPGSIPRSPPLGR